VALSVGRRGRTQEGWPEPLCPESLRKACVRQSRRRRTCL